MASKVKYTPVGDIPAIVDGAHAVFKSGKTRSLKWRRDQLKAMMRMVQENRAAMESAIREDLRRPSFECQLAEVTVVVSELKHALKNLDTWAQPQHVETPPAMLPGSSLVQPEPLGVTLIIGPWNFPIQLLLLPLLAAIAAGNAAVLKPSEVAPASAALTARLVTQYLDNDAVRIVQGGVPETTALLACRFDHILYTGNGVVGRIVMAAASKHLTPVTLELGGKSPAIVAADAPLRAAARKILSGKMLNDGQVCIAPDYVLVEGGAERQAAFVDALKSAMTDFYGSTGGAALQASPDIGRVVNRNHWARLTGYLKDCGGEVAIGGATDAADLWIEPTVVVNPRLDSALMTDEIFGPILPVLAVPHIDAAVDFVNGRDKPLALYVFTGSGRTEREVLSRTSAGGVVVNDTIMHNANHCLPFGGVGPSGLGAYHGVWGFKTFSHYKAVLRTSTLADASFLRFPPYSESRAKLLDSLLTSIPSLPAVGWRDALIAGLAAAVVALAVELSKKM